MQMIGVKYGSKLKKVKNHVRKKHKLINLTKSKFPAIVNSYHNYSLKDCPENFIITTKSPDGNIESIKHKSLPWEAIMWHPEREIRFQTDDKIRIQNLFK